MMKTTTSLALFTFVLCLLTGSVLPQTTQTQNIDGFMSLKFGTSKADVRKVVVATKLGTIDESVTDPELIVIDELKTELKSLGSSGVSMGLNFVDDKFYLAVIIKEMDRELYTNFLLIGSKDPLHFEEIKKDIDSRYKSADADSKSREATWTFSGSNGSKNAIILSQEENKLVLSFVDGSLLNLKQKREADRYTAEVHSEKAMSYYREKKFDLAIAEFSEAIRLNSDHKDAYHFRGHSYVSTGKLGLAITDFTSALRLDPENTHYLNDRAYAYANDSGSKYDLALADLSRAIKLKANDSRPYLLRARIFCAQGKKALAAADEKDAAALGATISEPCT